LGIVIPLFVVLRPDVILGDALKTKLGGGRAFSD